MEKLSQQIAKQLRDGCFGGNWTAVNLQESVADVTWQQATAKVGSFNTIAALVYHINYYITAANDVLQGQPLTAHDKHSFDCPVISSPEDWQKLLDEVWTNVEKAASLIVQLTDDKLAEGFDTGKYGSYFRNIEGVIEHLHYHLGQIVLLKKMLGTS